MPYCMACIDIAYGEHTCEKAKPSELHSIVPARMPEQSNAEALAGDSSVPGDSRREVEELLVDAEEIIQRSILNDAKAVRRVIKALRILNENRSLTEK